MVSKIYKEILKLKKKKRNLKTQQLKKTTLKWAKVLKRTSPKKIYRWQRSKHKYTYITYPSVQFSSVSSVAQSCLTLRPHGLQHTRLPCPSPTPRAYINWCPSSRWCHPTISSSVVPFSSCLQSFPASGSFQMSQFFTSGGQSIRVLASASVLPMYIQDWFPLRLTGFVSLWSKELSRVFSNTTVQKHQFFGTQLSL